MNNTDEWDERRINLIAQNGNTGEHYKYIHSWEFDNVEIDLNISSNYCLSDFVNTCKWLFVAFLEILVGVWLISEDNGLVATTGAAFVFFGVFSIVAIIGAEVVIRQED